MVLRTYFQCFAPFAFFLFRGNQRGLLRLCVKNSVIQSFNDSVIEKDVSLQGDLIYTEKL